MEHPHDPDPGGPELGPDGPGLDQPDGVDGPGLPVPDPGPVDLDPLGPPDPLGPDDHHGGPPDGPGPHDGPTRPDPAAPEPVPAQPPSQVGGVHGPGVDDLDQDGPLAPVGSRPVELPDTDTDTDTGTDTPEPLGASEVTAGATLLDAPDAGAALVDADGVADDEVRLDLEVGADPSGDDQDPAPEDDGLLGDDADLLLPVQDAPDGPPEPFAPSPDNGWLTATLLASAIGTAAAAAMVRHAGGAPLSSRRAAASMEEQGVDARVEHGSMSALGGWLASPTDVVRVAVHTAGGEPTACTVVDVDEANGTVLVEEPGPMGMRFDVRLHEFERSWADTAYETLVAEHDDRTVRTLPVTLGANTLLSPGW